MGRIQFLFNIWLDLNRQIVEQLISLLQKNTAIIWKQIAHLNLWRNVQPFLYWVCGSLRIKTWTHHKDWIMMNAYNQCNKLISYTWAWVSSNIIIIMIHCWRIQTLKIVYEGDKSLIPNTLIVFTFSEDTTFISWL